MEEQLDFPEHGLLLVRELSRVGLAPLHAQRHYLRAEDYIQFNTGVPRS